MSRWKDTHRRKKTERTGPDLPHIRLEEQIVRVQHTSAERAIYLAQAHDAPSLDSSDAFSDQSKLNALRALLSLCAHFQATGAGSSTTARAECGRIGEQKEQRVAKAQSIASSTHEVMNCALAVTRLQRQC